MNRTIFSMRSYVDGLFNLYSKLLVLRVDLSYKRDRASVIDIADLKKDVNRFLGNRRSKTSIFNSMVGYILKYEYGSDKGPHCHAIFFLDGNLVRHDEYIADLIGQYWSDVIARGDGLYYNCNRSKHQYSHLGIGMIAYWDDAKRHSLLEHVIGYLDKTEQSIEMMDDEKGWRSFTRGVLPVRESAAGRPRLYQSNGA